MVDTFLANANADEQVGIIDLGASYSPPTQSSGYYPWAPVDESSLSGLRIHQRGATPPIADECG